MLSDADKVSLFITEISPEERLPLIIENSVWGDKILPVIIEWAVVASMGLEAFLLAQPVLRRIIENVYVLGVREGVTRANDPLRKLRSDVGE